MEQQLPAPRDPSKMTHTARRCLDELLARGEIFVRSGLLPDSIETPEQALTIMLAGEELGLKPMQTFAHFYIVDGRPAMDTKLMGALYRAAGHSYEIGERGKERVLGTFRLKGGEVFEYTLTRDEAHQAGWDQRYDSQKQCWVTKDNWRRMPTLMLYYRWLSSGIRMVAPEVLFGVLTRDEALDVIVSTPPVQVKGSKDFETKPPKEPPSIAWTRSLVQDFSAWLDEHALTQEEGLSLAAAYYDVPVPERYAELPSPSYDDLLEAIESELMCEIDASAVENKPAHEPASASEQASDVVKVAYGAKHLIQTAVAHRGSEHPASEKQRKAVARCLDALTPQVDGTETTYLRGCVLDYLVGVDAVEDLNKGEASSLIAWAILGGEGDDGWNPDPQAREEVEAILELVGAPEREVA